MTVHVKNKLNVKTKYSLFYNDLIKKKFHEFSRKIVTLITIHLFKISL